jgi:hypothetical protein
VVVLDGVVFECPCFTEMRSSVNEYGGLGFAGEIAAGPDALDGGGDDEVDISELGSGMLEFAELADGIGELVRDVVRACERGSR